MKVKSESEVAQSCPTPRDPMDCSPPGSSVHGIFQARVLEWGAIAFSTKTVWIYADVEFLDLFLTFLRAKTVWRPSKKLKIDPEILHLRIYLAEESRVSKR